MAATQTKSIDLYKAVGIPLTILVCVLSVILMQVISDVRIKELKISLQNIDSGKSAGKTLALIARYRLIRNRYNAKSEGAKDYLAEGELMAVLSGEFNDGEIGLESIFGFLEGPALFTVNAVGALVGAPPVTNLSEDRGHKILETAYFYERKRQFKKTVQIYSVAEEYFSGEDKTLNYIYLHKGFCLSLIGERKQALQ